MINIKLDFEGNIHCIQPISTINELMFKILEIHKDLLKGSFYIKYFDYDKDLITVDSEDDFILMKEFYFEKKFKNIKIFIILKAEEKIQKNEENSENNFNETKKKSILKENPERNSSKKNSSRVKFKNNEDESSGFQLNLYEIPCFKCEKIINENCKKCNGKGQIKIKGKKFKLTQYLIEFKLKTKFSQLLELNENYKNNKDSELCNNCYEPLSDNIQYLCMNCDKYLICEKCEENSIHSHHQFLKLRKSQINDKENLQTHIKKYNEKKIKENRNSIESYKNNSFFTPFKINYKSKIIENLVVNEVEKGKSFIHSLEIVNNGEDKFPEDLRLQCINGIYEGCSEKILALESGKNQKIEISLEAPNEIGIFTSYWRLTYEDFKCFGTKVKTEIKVLENEKKGIFLLLKD